MRMAINKYAIIEIGSRQFMVCEGEVVSIYKNDSITTFNTLVFKDGDTLNIGTPYVENGGVLLTYTGDTKVKSIVRRFRGKSRYRVNKSHTDILANYIVSKLDKNLQNKIESKKEAFDKKSVKAKQRKLITKSKVATKKVTKTSTNIKKVNVKKTKKEVK